VGIGGVGLSAIATLLLERGYSVSGSDLRDSPLLRRLASQGATVHVGHDAAHLPPEAALVIVSSAIPPGNPEVEEARRRGLPVLKRADFLDSLTDGAITVAVTGTHGKTTTTALITWLLTAANQEPTFIVGGIIQNLDTNARAGRGKVFVIEADEYDGMFLGLHPYLAVITTVEHDHPDCYPTLADMVAAMTQFAMQIQRGGCLFVCGDEDTAWRIGQDCQSRGLRVVSYGLGDGLDWRADQVTRTGGGSRFTLWHQDQNLGWFEIALPGRHNVRNALAALAVVHELGLPPANLGPALAAFRGTARRFEEKGTAGGVTVVDDYAHHPTEIRATLAAARERYGDRPLWVMFQPHTYSRTRTLLDQFAVSFAEADHVIVTDIYAAREQNTLGISAANLVAAMNHPDVCYIGPLEEVTEYLLQRLKPGDVLLTLGAGDGNQVGQAVLRRLQSREAF